MAERITGHTELIGLIATPIRHSSSPRMHNEAFAKLGLDYDLECLGTSVPRSRLHCDVGMLHQTVLRYLQGNYLDRKSTRLNSSHRSLSRMPSSA